MSVVGSLDGFMLAGQRALQGDGLGRERSERGRKKLGEAAVLSVGGASRPGGGGATRRQHIARERAREASWPANGWGREYIPGIFFSDEFPIVAFFQKENTKINTSRSPICNLKHFVGT